MSTHALRLLGLVAALALAGCEACDTHAPYCGLARHCVEGCGETPFVQCGPCPDGSRPAGDCADGGR